MSSPAPLEPTSGVQPATDHGAGAAAITLVEATASPYNPLRVGTLIAERYRVERFIDAGGMAQIFEATNVELDERVALKLAHSIYRSNPELVARFRAEARALARIRSEHVGRVFDVVSTDAGDPVMVMELLEGENLARLTAKRGAQSLEDVVGWAIETCGGLSVAHANGIVHRDVKPENIFIANVLGGRRTVKLLDFGISRLALTTSGASSERKSRDPAAELKILGTPLYMAPEQILSPRAADPRIDIWSLGVVLFELLAGRPPFTGKNVDELCGQILDGEIPDLQDQRPDLDPELVSVVHRCLSREPDGRFPSVADLAVALLPWGPPRLAVSVEQTVHVLRAAGLTTVDVPAIVSMRPSADHGVTSPRPSGRVSLSVAPASSPRSSKPSRQPPGVDPSPVPPSIAPTAPSPPAHSPSRNLFIGGAVLVAVLAAGVVASGFLRRNDPPVAAAAAPVKMRFETDPSGAMLEIDGAAAGMTPAGAVLLPGRHVVTLTKPGFERLSTVVDVSGQAGTDPARFPLTPLPGTAREPASEAPRAGLNTADDKPASGKDTTVRPRAAGQPLPASPPSAAPAAGPKATVKVIDDKPSTTRVIQ